MTFIDHTREMVGDDNVYTESQQIEDIHQYLQNLDLYYYYVNQIFKKKLEMN